MSATPLYEFTFWRYLADSRNVPLVNARPTTVTVRAADEVAAREKVTALSGPAPDPVMSHRSWHFDLRSISEVSS